MTRAAEERSAFRNARDLEAYLRANSHLPGLRDGRLIGPALAVLDAATGQVMAARDRRADDVRVLRQALAYAWSVIIAADPPQAWDVFLRWAGVDDPDIRRIVAENLKKNRLRRLNLTP